MPDINQVVLDANKDRVDKLQQYGYIPTTPATSWKQPMPMATKDQQVFGSAPTGIPADWDYKTSPVSPSGEPLPQGAQGWTPQGEPFFGGESAIANWWNGLSARINKPVEKPDLTAAENYMSAFQRASEAFKAGDYWNWFTSSIGAVVSGGIGAVTDLGKVVSNIGANESQQEAGGLQKGVRAVTEIVGGGLALIQEGAQQLEQVRGGLQSAGQAIGLEESVTGQWIKKVAEDGTAKWAESMLYSIDPIGIGWDLIRGVSGLIAGKAQEFSEGYQAGRVLYSQVLDPMLKEDYLARLRAGENPYLLAQELQNPGAELAGQLFADPIILYGVVAKSLRNAGWMDKATDIVGKIDDATIETKLSATAATEAERISKISEVAEDGVKWIDNISQGIVQKIDTTKGLRGLTAAGMRYSIGVTTGSFFQEIASTMKLNRAATYLDDTLEVVRGFMQMGAGNAKSFTEGLNIVTRYLPTNVALSKAGGEFAVYLNKLLPDAAAASSFLEDLSKAEDATSLLTKYSKEIDAFTKDFVPTMSDRIARGEKIGLTGQAIARFDKAATSPLVRGINNFFGIVYMGTSPGYAMRNIINNAFTIFTDRGVGSTIDYLKPAGGAEALAELEKIGGGVVDLAAKEGIGPIASALGAADEKGGILRYFQRVSTNWESKASLILYRDGVVDTMNKAVTAAFRDLAPQMKGVDAGLLRRLIIENHFDPKKAFEVYREATATGSIDLFKSGVWMTEAQTKALKEYGWFDDYTKALSEVPADDLAAKQSVTDAFFKDRVEAFAAEAAKEPAAMSTHLADAADHLPNLPQKSNYINAQQKTANSISDGKWSEAIETGLEIAKKIDGTPGAGIPRMVQPILDKRPEFYALFREYGAENIPDAFLGRYNELWDWRLAEYQRVVKGNQLNRAGLDFAEVARQLGIPSDVAETITTKKELVDSFWTEYFTFARQHFSRGREEYAKLANEFLEEMGKIDPRLVDGSKMSAAVDATTQARLLDSAIDVQKGNMITADGSVISRTPYGGFGDTPTLPRVHAESLDGQRALFDELKQTLQDTHGVHVPVIGDSTVLDALEKEMTARMTTGRFVAGQVGKRYRDFGIHDYAMRTNMDTAAGLVYPYQFWHSRTYKNWFTRLVSDPAVIAAYAKYKNYMSEIHAGLPDWWKYNINTNELLGLKSDHPLFFNLEQTLNPLNGLTGVDFNDPYKRVNWWSQTLDDMNKLGPSTWTPLSILTAVALYMQGETDAASRWAGRLFPQSATLEAVGNLAGLDPFNSDPFVAIFSNGIDPYTRRRVGRALAAMVSEGLVSQEDAIDAAYTQKGDIWTQAWGRAVSERAPGQLSSFFLGTGFKARSVSDIQIDQFYADYARMWNMRPNLSPDEFSQQMDMVRQKYPFMDALLLSNKQDDQRDAALAYTVMNRLPPRGGSIAEAAGIPPDLYSKFYDTKGDWTFDEEDKQALADKLAKGEITQQEYDKLLAQRTAAGSWSETDKARFMAGIIDMAAILAIPDVATRQEWTAVSSQYKQVTAAMQQQFGADINDKIDQFYTLRKTSEESADAFLAAHPEVSQAMDYQAQTITSNPLLTAYYGGIEKIIKYYKGVMYAEGERRFGSDIFDLQTAYYNFTKLSTDEMKRLRAYWTFKHAYERNELLTRVLSLATKLPDTIPASIRTEVPASEGQTGILQELNQPQQVIPIEVIQDAIGKESLGLISDYIQYGQPLPAVVQRRLEQIAQQARTTEEELLRQISQSLLSQVYQ